MRSCWLGCWPAYALNKRVVWRLAGALFGWGAAEVDLDLSQALQGTAVSQTL